MTKVIAVLEPQTDQLLYDVPGMQPDCIVVGKAANKTLLVPGERTLKWVIVAILVIQGLIKVRLVQGLPQFVIRQSRGTLEVKKEGRWKRYRWEGFRRHSR